MIFESKLFKSIVFYLSAFLVGILSTVIYNLAEKKTICEKKKYIKELEQGILERDMSHPYLIQFVLGAFNDKFMEFEKITDNNKKDSLVKAFFQYKKVINSIHEHQEIDKGYMSELNDLEKFLCDQYDCSEFKESELEKKGSPKK